jgi:hypothetical protein
LHANAGLHRGSGGVSKKLFPAVARSVSFLNLVYCDPTNSHQFKASLSLVPQIPFSEVPPLEIGTLVNLSNISGYARKVLAFVVKLMARVG